ncbi:MAG: AIR synthase related protein, partial [Thermoanaerobaculia bacterium]|nr:AIR synthase related protein [Thermoanaerobaculia bacterium]
MSAPPSGEDRLVDWLRHNVPGGERLGDDAVVLQPDGPIAVSVDQQIEGVHFPSGLDPAWLAPRLLEVCLSDLAATAARARQAVLALAAPETWPRRRFFTALAKALDDREMALVGGDTARAERVRLALWVVGDRPPRGRFVDRTGAEPGDRLWLGGPVGWSALGRQIVAEGGRPEGRRL